jgi:hypothetical protein
MSSRIHQERIDNRGAETRRSTASTEERKQINNKEEMKMLVVGWLTDNYERRNEGSTRKARVYRHYVNLCAESGLVPLTAPIFGKLVKKTFPWVRSKRKGKNGKSTHHYVGLHKKRDRTRPTQSEPPFIVDSKFNSLRSVAWTESTSTNFADACSFSWLSSSAHLTELPMAASLFEDATLFGDRNIQPSGTNLLYIEDSAQVTDDRRQAQSSDRQEEFGADAANFALTWPDSELHTSHDADCNTTCFSLVPSADFNFTLPTCLPDLQQGCLLLSQLYKNFYNSFWLSIFNKDLHTAERLLIGFWRYDLPASGLTDLLRSFEIKTQMLQMDRHALFELADLLMINPLNWNEQEHCALLLSLSGVLAHWSKMAAQEGLKIDNGAHKHLFSMKFALFSCVGMTLRARADFVSLLALNSRTSNDRRGSAEHAGRLSCCAIAEGAGVTHQPLKVDQLIV